MTDDPWDVYQVVDDDDIAYIQIRYEGLEGKFASECAPEEIPALIQHLVEFLL